MKMTTRTRKWIANICLLSVTAAWGATFTLTKNALHAVPVFPYLTARFLIAFVLLVLVSLCIPSTRKAFTGRVLWVGALLGLCLFGTYAFQTIGLQSTSASMAGFLTGVNIMLVPLLSVPILRTRLSARTSMAAIVAFIGLACLCGLQISSFSAGDIYVLLCAVFVALQVVWIEKWAGQLDSLAVATVEIGVLAMCCLFTEWLSPEPIWHAALWLKPMVVWAILVCAIPATALAYWLQNVFQRDTSAAETAIIFSMEPVFTAIIAFIWLHETLSVLQWTGAAFVFASMWLADPNIRWSGFSVLRRSRQI